METLLDSMQLSGLISDHIKQRGIISFRDYMEIAL
jgi:SAM-dependent MidA family methyltransferase